MGAPRNDIRKALAGLNFLEGQTGKQALIAAGVSPATARNPAQNGFGAAQCLDAAKALVPEADLATIVQQARRVLGKKLKIYEDKPKSLQMAKASEIARIVEVTEKYYGDRGATDPLSPRKFLDRAEWLLELINEAKARRIGAITVESEPIEVDSQD